MDIWTIPPPLFANLEVILWMVVRLGRHSDPEKKETRRLGVASIACVCVCVRDILCVFVGACACLSV